MLKEFFTKASDIEVTSIKTVEEVPREQPLTEEEIKFLEEQFEYSFVIYESDILRYRFDVQQFTPNVAYEIQFLDLMPLYNEWYFKNSREFLNLYKKTYTVIKVLGHESMFLLLLTDKPQNAKALMKLSQMKSFKYKANLTKKERSLLYQIRNYSYLPNYMVSYMKVLEWEKEDLEEDLEAKEEIYEVYSKFYDNLRGTKDPRKATLRSCTEYLYNDIKELEEQIKTINKKIDEYLFSITEEETTTEDYEW